MGRSQHILPMFDSGWFMCRQEPQRVMFDLATRGQLSDVAHMFLHLALQVELALLRQFLILVLIAFP